MNSGRRVERKTGLSSRKGMVGEEANLGESKNKKKVEYNLHFPNFVFCI